MKSILCTCTCIIAIGLVVPASSQQLNSTLHSTSHGVHFAYVGEYVVFTCISKGSNSIAWSSDEYIGSGGLRLEFISIDMETTQRIGQTVATLTEVFRVEEKVILVSQLQITVQSTHQISSITCHNLGNDTTNTVSFDTAANTSVVCDKPAACPGETVTCTCTTANSNNLTWSSDEYIGQGDMLLEFALDDPLLTRRNVTGLSTFALLTDSSNSNGVVVLTSDLTLIASGNPNDILTCMNVGHQNSYSIIIPVSRNCGADSTTSISTVATDLVTTVTEVNAVTVTDGNHSTGFIIGICLLFCIILVLVLIVVFMAILLYTKKKDKHPTNSTSDNDIELQAANTDQQILEELAYWKEQAKEKAERIKELQTIKNMQLKETMTERGREMSSESLKSLVDDFEKELQNRLIEE